MSAPARTSYEVIVIGGGHAGVEAAWSAANLLGEHHAVALVTLDPAKIGVMSCNPAIGGLAKGQLVREVDALNGLMGLAADATGIQFKVLNRSKGPAVRGPRCQSDKHAYAEFVRRAVEQRAEIDVIAGAVTDLLFGPDGITGVRIADREDGSIRHVLSARAVVLTTGTFMRGLMHTGDAQTPGGRCGEAPASAISACLTDAGFELTRLKTGTPPRLRKGSIDWDGLAPEPGDAAPEPFSDITDVWCFPPLEQVVCRSTRTDASAHELIRDNLHRAPMFTGQIGAPGPRYCPSIEDKVVRFPDRLSHNVFLEPESLRSDWVYCNGISTSLPLDVQEYLVRSMPGCERAEILQPGYAVEYDASSPHQIDAGGMTKLVDGLFFAGQINGTSGYEEAAAQGVVAGVNAARYAGGMEPITLGRDEAYIGVLMDDLVTKVPVEPYRMFTSRAEHRLLLRSDNAADRLTPIADRLGLLSGTEAGRGRAARFRDRRAQLDRIAHETARIRLGNVPLADMARRPEFGPERLAVVLREHGHDFDRGVVFTHHTELFYAAYVVRQQAEIKRHAEMERRRIPETFDYRAHGSIRTEAREALAKFRPGTFGQARRLEGVTPADLTLLAILVERFKTRSIAG